VFVEVACRRGEAGAGHPTALLVEVRAQVLGQRVELPWDARVVGLHQRFDALDELAMRRVHFAEAERHGLH